MYIIVVYDIATDSEDGSKRLRHILKLCRQYIHHIQKSVFEGEISEAKLEKLMKSIENIIDSAIDYVVIYKVDNKNNLKRLTIGKDFNPQEDIL